MGLRLKKGRKSKRGAPASGVRAPAPPGAEDFTPRAVGRAVLAETVQHPLTILPAAAAAVGGLYMGLIGLDPAAFAVTFGSVLVAAGAWVVNYFIRGETLAERHVESLRELRRELRREEVASLEAEWAETGFADGIQQARELSAAYAKLTDFLRGRLAETSSLGVERMLVLAEDSYREGGMILRQALVSYRALRDLDAVKLRREIAVWRGQLEGLGDGEGEAAQAAALETRIASNTRRLDLYREKVESLQGLLAESETLESALETAYLEAVDLQNPDMLFNRGQAASELERAVAAARRADERLRNLDQSAAHEDDEIYMTAGRDS